MYPWLGFMLYWAVHATNPAHCEHIAHVDVIELVEFQRSDAVELRIICWTYHPKTKRFYRMYSMDPASCELHFYEKGKGAWVAWDTLVGRFGIGAPYFRADQEPFNPEWVGWTPWPEDLMPLFYSTPD